MGVWQSFALKRVKTVKNRVFLNKSAAPCQISVFLLTIVQKWPYFRCFYDCQYTHTPDPNAHFLDVASKTVKNSQKQSKSSKSVKKQSFLQNRDVTHLWKCHFWPPLRIWSLACPYGPLCSIQKKPGELPVGAESGAAVLGMTTRDRRVGMGGCRGMGWYGGVWVWGVVPGMGYGVQGPVQANNGLLPANTGQYRAITGQYRAITDQYRPIPANMAKFD